MDLTWLILLVLIGIVSSIMNKRAEQKAKDRQERGESAPTPTPRGSTGPPVAPGPLNRPRRVERPTPRPAERQASRPDRPAPHAPSAPPAERGAHRTDDDKQVFEEMRRQLRGRHDEAQREEQRRHAEAERQRREIERLEREAERQRRQAAHLRTTESKPDRSPTMMEQPHRTSGTPVEAPARTRRSRARFDAAGMRRAVVMKEILDKPIALRDPSDPWDSY